MVDQVEISSIDLRYEGYRLRSVGAEKALLLSISAQGIREPLAGVDKADQRILLDGFKRYRCAIKLNIGVVPYLSLAGDEPAGIIELMRISNAKSLSILEQARLIDELINVHQMCNAQIATLLERSKAWVMQPLTALIIGYLMLDTMKVTLNTLDDYHQLFEENSNQNLPDDTTI